MLSSHYWRVAFRKFTDATGREKQNTPVEAGVFANDMLLQNYSLSELGSDRFFGDFLFRKAIISWPEGGRATAPLRTICLVVRLPLLSFLFAPLSWRSVEPSKETPANKPQE